MPAKRTMKTRIPGVLKIDETKGEWAFRLKDPKQFKVIRTKVIRPGEINFIVGRKAGKMQVQAVRLKKDAYTFKEAVAWMRGHPRLLGKSGFMFRGEEWHFGKYLGQALRWAKRKLGFSAKKHHKTEPTCADCLRTWHEVPSHALKVEGGELHCMDCRPSLFESEDEDEKTICERCEEEFAEDELEDGLCAECTREVRREERGGFREGLYELD